MTYKLFLQTPDGSRFEPQETESRTKVAKQFQAFLNRDDLKDSEVSIHLMHGRSVLALHRFNVKPGSKEDWHGMLGEIIWPARVGAGRPAEMKEGSRRNIYLDNDSVKRAMKLGKGNVSEGIRIALAR